MTHWIGGVAQLNTTPYAEESLTKIPWYQWPLLRYPLVGRAQVFMLFALSGLVLSQGPWIAQSPAQIRSKVSSSALRRLPRLALPCLASTVFSLVLLFCGAYQAADCAGGWLAQAAPHRTSDCFLPEIAKFAKNMVIIITNRILLSLILLQFDSRRYKCGS